MDKLENVAAEIEEHIEDITNDLTDVNCRKVKVEKELEENRQAVRVLRVRCQMNDAKIGRLETQLNELNVKNDGIVEEYIRVSLLQVSKRIKGHTYLKKQLKAAGLFKYI